MAKARTKSAGAKRKQTRKPAASAKAASAKASPAKAKVRRRAPVVAKARRRSVTASAPPAPKVNLPSYDQLLQRTDAPAGSAWGLFGNTDELGTMNLITAEVVRLAAAEITKGSVFSLNQPISFPQMVARGPYRHNIILPTGNRGRDDYLDNFYLQGSSQWDALCHVKHPTFGAYNGFQEAELPGNGGTRLGIHNLAERGIAGRGVLVDLARYYEKHGWSIDYNSRQVFPLTDVRAALVEQKSPLRPGDILLARIGFTRYLKTHPERYNEILQQTSNRENMIPPMPGIEASRDVLRWLWDNHVAAVATDGVAWEAVPLNLNSDNDVCMHHHLLGLFGMQIGELWELESLADDCAADGRYTFFLTSSPLNVAGGVGSPPNALAIK
jgi:kynurenine formamidase